MDIYILRLSQCEKEGLGDKYQWGDWFWVMYNGKSENQLPLTLKEANLLKKEMKERVVAQGGME